MSGTEKVSLWRADDELVVGMSAEADAESTLDALTRLGGPLAGFEVSRQIGTSAAVLSRPGGSSLPVDLKLIKSISGVEWAGPVFTFGGGGAWMVVNNEVIVALHPGTDPREFFADSKFSGYRPLLGTSDQFVATVADGGGLVTLDVANQLYTDVRVAWAAPNGNVDFQGKRMSKPADNRPSFS